MTRWFCACFLAVMAVTSGLLLAAALIWPPLAVASVPCAWPFLIIFGADETTERYGVHGELIRLWFCAIPVAAMYALIWSRIRQGDRT